MIRQTKAEVTTAEQLFTMSDDEKRHELVQGILNVMSPAGREHGRIASRILIRLGVHVESNKLGETFAAETGFLIESNPDTVRAPDAAFVSHFRLDQVADYGGAYLPLAPDLVIEVVSPNDRSSDVEAKASQWLKAGSQVVLVADPITETLRVYRDQSQIIVLRAGETYFSEDICGNWELGVDEVFQSRGS